MDREYRHRNSAYKAYERSHSVKAADNATGVMQETENGSGYFEEVTLYPTVIVKMRP